MKKTIFSVITLILFSAIQCNAQDWCTGAPNFTLNVISNESDLIFEGRVLSDSAFFMSSPGSVFTYHRVLILKQFKGQYQSDTLIVANEGGRMIIDDRWEGEKDSYIHAGDEVAFFVSKGFGKHRTHSDIYYVIYGSCGMIKVCEKKDVVKEIYEPIQAVLGQKYTEVHPNKCATKQQQKK